MNAGPGRTAAGSSPVSPIETSASGAASRAVARLAEGVERTLVRQVIPGTTIIEGGTIHYQWLSWGDGLVRVRLCRDIRGRSPGHPRLRRNTAVM